MLQEFTEFDEKYLSPRKPNIPLDIYITRKYYDGLKAYKTVFKPRGKNSECDNACEKQGFKRGSWRTKKYWRKV